MHKAEECTPLAQLPATVPGKASVALLLNTYGDASCPEALNAQQFRHDVCPCIVAGAQGRAQCCIMAPWDVPCDECDQKNFAELVSLLERSAV